MVHSSLVLCFFHFRILILTICQSLQEAQNGLSTFKIEDGQLPVDIACIAYDEFSGYRRLLIGGGSGACLSSIEGHTICELRKKDMKLEITAVAHVNAPEGRFFVAGGWKGRIYLWADDPKAEASTIYPTEVWSPNPEQVEDCNDDMYLISLLCITCTFHPLICALLPG